MTLRSSLPFTNKATRTALSIHGNDHSFVSVQKVGCRTKVVCSGVMGVTQQQNLREAINLALKAKPETIILDLSSTQILESGHSILSAIVAECFEKGSAVEIHTSAGEAS